MTPEAKDSRAPFGGRGASCATRAWVFVVDGLAAFGTLLIVGLMLVISADVFARNLLGASLPLVSELGALMLVMIVYLQLATTVRADRLARTEIFFVPFRDKHPVAGAMLGAVFDLVGAAMIGLIAWSTAGILSKDYASGEYIGVTGIATLPTWPFRLLILVGVTVAAIECVLRSIAAFRTAAKGSEA